MRSIVQFDRWPYAAIEPLVQDSLQEGFHFLQRLKDQWLSGANRFSGKGEALFGIFEGDRLLAVGGINRQSDDCARLRRFYVRKDVRREGLGRMLVQHILRFASAHYTRVFLRTDTPAADQFYLAVGFSHLFPGSGSTHIIELKDVAKPPPA
jgi:GNAT superfamily N-acetyltransferase